MEEMAQQEGGWPLGLQPLNLRVGQVRSLDFSGNLSTNTTITDSPTSSSVSSSDSGTESTGSFFHDRSITFGSLIGISSILDLSNTSLRRSRKQGRPRAKKTQKTKTWFSLCPRTHLSSEMARETPSLGHFLEVERRASNVHRSNSVPATYELDGLHGNQSTTPLDPNSLFSNGLVAPPQVQVDGDVKPSNTWVSSRLENPSGGLVHGNGYSFALVCPCLGGDSSH